MAVAESVTVPVTDSRFSTPNPHALAKSDGVGETTRTMALAICTALSEVERVFESVQMKHGITRRVCTFVRGLDV